VLAEDAIKAALHDFQQKQASAKADEAKVAVAA
jgi:hypothetical protein